MAAFGPRRRLNEQQGEIVDQLTSVRLNEQLLDSLRLIADAHGTSVAAEIRVALDKYVKEVTSSPQLKVELKKQIAEREKLIDRLLQTA